MKTKTCHTCQQGFSVMFRVQLQKGQPWIFVCATCCKQHQKGAFYRYGGTWKGARH